MLIHTSSELAQLHHKSPNFINNSISTCGSCPDVAKPQKLQNVLVLLEQNTHLRRGMGEALIKRFLKRYCLKPDGSTGSSSLWGVSTRTQGVAPSSDQHFYKRKKNFRVTAREVRTGITQSDMGPLLYDYSYRMRFKPTGDTRR